MKFDSNTLEKALIVLGDLIKDRGLQYEVVAVGGGSLLLLGQILRTTKDLDLVALVHNGEFISANPLPPPLIKAIYDVGQGLNIATDWVNIGPADLFTMGLPDGFVTRMHTFHYGGLTIHLAGRFDQICFKLYAAVDQGPESKHFADLKSLKPDKIELEEAKRWCITHDVSAEFLNELTTAIAMLRS